ncbi:phospholipase effector Tle1 domain-containing protein [Zobellia nedashkovskayae]
MKFAQVRFIGLFDSVASHGFVQHNDAVDLGLDSVKHAKHTFHLASADEHRTKFSLTDIRSAGSRVYKSFYPGYTQTLVAVISTEQKKRILV